MLIHTHCYDAKGYARSTCFGRKSISHIYTQTRVHIEQNLAEHAAKVELVVNGDGLQKEFYAIGEFLVRSQPSY